MSAYTDLQFPVLIGDVGGTNARFQIIEHRQAPPLVLEPACTVDFSNIEQALESVVFNRTSVRPRSAILAAAGPITENGLNLTNCHWNIVPASFLDAGSMEQLLLMNDFEAQALSLPELTDEDGVRLGGPRQPSDDPMTKAVIGPGTGLGVGLLVRAGGRWIPVAGEGGHVDLGPRNDREAEVWHHLVALEGRISGEQVVCGDGLVNTYRACCAADGMEPMLERAADISTAAMACLQGGETAAGKNEQAVEALSLFCTTLGRIAGDLALTSMARGGVYIGGGIAQKILPFLKTSGFRPAFEDKAPHSALMRSIATTVVTHPLPALLGLAAYANAPQDFVVDIDHRLWTR